MTRRRLSRVTRTVAAVYAGAIVAGIALRVADLGATALTLQLVCVSFLIFSGRLF